MEMRTLIGVENFHVDTDTFQFLGFILMDKNDPMKWSINHQEYTEFDILDVKDVCLRIVETKADTISIAPIVVKDFEQDFQAALRVMTLAQKEFKEQFDYSAKANTSEFKEALKRVNKERALFSVQYSKACSAFRRYIMDISLDTSIVN
jgi:hypothetical protein